MTIIADIKSNTPLPVLRALRKLGRDISLARRKRRIPMALLSQRASIARSTLSKIEKGDAGVNIGAYAKVIFVMGMLDQIANLMDSTIDKKGQNYMEEDLPKRIRFNNKR